MLQEKPEKSFTDEVRRHFLHTDLGMALFILFLAAGFILLSCIFVAIFDWVILKCPPGSFDVSLGPCLSPSGQHRPFNDTLEPWQCGPDHLPTSMCDRACIAPSKYDATFVCIDMQSPRQMEPGAGSPFEVFCWVVLVVLAFTSAFLAFIWVSTWIENLSIRQHNRIYQIMNSIKVS